MPVPKGNQSKVMNPEESTYELIERYLKQECSVQEVQSIEERMATDQAFAQEVEWFRQFQTDMKERTSFSILSEFEKMKIEDQKLVKRKRQGRVGFLALVLVALVFLAYKFWSKPEEITIIEQHAGEDFEERLPQWEQYLSYGKGLQSLGEEDDDQLMKALQLIEASQADQAIPLLAQYLEALADDDDDFEIRLLYGKLLLREDLKVEKAKAAFQSVLESNALPMYQQAANYYLGITFLLTGQESQGQLILQEIAAQTDHPYRRQAEEILAAETVE